jgi:hypothetical protein
MLKIRFYHLRTLLWTYLMWAVLLILYACLLCIATHESLTNLPWIWVYLHATPLVYLPSLWPGIGIPVVFAATFSIVVGLLINKSWTRFLIVIGVSGWFFWAMSISVLWV